MNFCIFKVFLMQNLFTVLLLLVDHLLTFSSTLQTYWHQRMRKMMMTNSRMMVTRQPIRMAVFSTSGGSVADGLVAVPVEEI